MLYDCHSHSHLSLDGHDSILAMARAAQAPLGRQGLGGLTLTEHVDYEFSHPGFDFSDAEYRAEYDEARVRLAEEAPAFHLLRGVEFGLQPDKPHLYEAYRARAAREQYDLIIGSVHLLYGKDPYDGDFPSENRAQTVHDYLETVLATLDYEDFDVVGHIGYICKYGNYPDHVLHDAEAPELLDAILRRVVAQGRSLEMNTSTLARGDGAAMPELNILKHYRRLGGERVSLGSDAHRACELGRSFQQAAELLRCAGFRYTVWYEGRKPRFETL